MRICETWRIWKLVDTNGDLVADRREVLIDNLPADGRHRTKTIGFGPDGKLYLNVGTFSDDAAESPGRGTIWQYSASGTGGRVFASGLRNAVGYWRPSGDVATPSLTVTASGSWPTPVASAAPTSAARTR